jgi:hypothetical protein
VDTPQENGLVYDASVSGAMHHCNREYNARTGRHIQSDPLGLKGGINTIRPISPSMTAYAVIGFRNCSLFQLANAAPSAMAPILYLSGNH